MMKAGCIAKRALISMIFIFIILLPVLSAATDVGGIINTNTTWNLAGSPYNFTKKIQTADGVTLTIEPGVVVNANSYMLELRGPLTAIGTETAKISINSLFLIEASITATVNIQFAVINAGTYYLSQNSPLFSLRDSVIQNLSGITIFDSTNPDDSFIERNVFLNVSNWIRVGKSSVGYVHIRNNVFQNAGLMVDGELGKPAHTIIEYNSFLSIDRIVLYAETNAMVTAINNYWNTTNTSAIDSMIFDKNDDIGYQYFVEYIPFITAPHPDTPIPDFPAAPRLSLAPAANVPTGKVTVKGTGFSAYEAVDVYFDTEDLCLGATNGNGAFSCSLMIPREAIPGTHWLTAVGRKSGFAAQKSFLVRVNWSQFRNGPQHRGYNPYENVISPVNVAGLNEAWIYNMVGWSNSSPAVVNGMVYVCSQDGNLCALDAFTGASKWSYTTGNTYFSSPAVANGLVYVGSTDGKLYALDAATGAFRWSYPIGDKISSPPAVANGVVYVGSQDFNLYALDAATGAFKWSYPTGDKISSSPAVANGLVYVGSTDGKLYALDAATGAFKWSYPTGNSNFSSPAVANGVVYVGGGGGTLYAIKAKTGALKWSYPAGDEISSSPAVANGVVYVGASTHNEIFGNPEGSFYALDAAIGVLKWTYPMGWDQNAFTTAVANGVVYVVSGSYMHAYPGDFYALDAATGALKWGYTTASAYFDFGGSPAVANGLVYVVLSFDLYCFSLDPAGVLSQKIPRPDPALLIPDGRLKPQVKKR